MKVIINGGLALGLILFCSFIVGHFVTKIIKIKPYIFRNIIYGFTFLISIFEVMSIICIKFNVKFHVLQYLYVGIVAFTVFVLLGFFIYTKQYKQYIKKNILRNFIFLELILTILVIMFQMFQSCYLNHTDADDGYFIAISNIAVEKDVIILEGDSVYNGGESYTESVRSDTFSWELFIATISKTFNIHPAILTHSMLPAFLIFMCYLAFYEVGRKIILNRKKRYLFMLFISILNLFGGYAVYSSGCFLLLRVWQGKAMLVNFAFPMLIANCICIYQKRDNIYTWIFNVVIVLSGMAFTTVGIYLMPITYLIVGIPYIINRIIKKDMKRVFILLRNATLSMLPIVLFDVYTFLLLMNSSTGEKYMQRAAHKWGDIFEMTMMRGSYFVLLLLCCIYLVVKKRKKVESLLFVGMVVALFITFLNPYFTELVAQKVTGVDVYWRLYWIMPIYIIIAYVLSDLIYKEKKLIEIITIGMTILLIKCAGSYIYEDKLYFTEHTNKYKIPDEVIQVCNLIIEDDRDVTCLFPPKLAYYPRQYTSKINVIKARGMSENKSLILDTSYSYVFLYKKVYENHDIDSDEIENLLNELNVEYIYTRDPINTKNYVLYNVFDGYGYLYKVKDI